MMTKKYIIPKRKNWKENISKQQRWWTLFFAVQINLFIIENIAAEHWTFVLECMIVDRRNELGKNKSQIASTCDQNVFVKRRKIQ